MMIAFGPVPSRRLGRSLGISNIPPKLCPYSCIYCQLGPTLHRSYVRRTFWRDDEILAAVQTKLVASERAGESIDYLTFVSDGEPTLDANLGRTIRALRSLGIAIAVISNGALIAHADVRRDLAEADWVSLKVDAASERTWRRINRPSARLHLQPILDGMRAFARDFAGTLTTETMLLYDFNDSEAELRAIAGLIGELRPAPGYLAVPTRPPAEPWALPASEATIARAYEIFSERHDRIELLLGYEGNAFAATGDARDDLLSITAVHPMREAAVRRLIERDGGSWSLVPELIKQGQLVEIQYGDHRYFLRPIRSPAQEYREDAAD